MMKTTYTKRESIIEMVKVLATPFDEIIIEDDLFIKGKNIDSIEIHLNQFNDPYFTLNIWNKSTEMQLDESMLTNKELDKIIIVLENLF